MTRRGVSAVTPTGSDLERLLETERRLEELVARARDEAAAEVGRAREEAGRRAEAGEASLAVGVAELEQTITREVEAEEADTRRLAADQAARYRSVSPDRVAELAAQGVARLLEWAAGGDA